MSGLDKRVLVFPEKYQNVNRKAFDVDVHGYVALGTGTSVNLACVRGSVIERCYSFSVGSGMVSALIFGRKSTLFLGTSTGAVYYYSLSSRRFLGQELASKELGGVVKMARLGEYVVVMYSSRRIIAYNVSAASERKDKVEFAVIWEIVVDAKMNDFVVDPFKGDRIFVFGKDTGSFSIYAVKNGRSPKVVVESFTLSDNLIIQSAVFSEHMNRYVIMVTEQALLWYDIDLNLIAPVLHHQKTVSQFDSIIQFRNDHRKVLGVHKTGTISLYEVSDDFELKVQKEVMHFAQTQTLVSIMPSPMQDDQLVAFYAPLGLALLDASSFNMVSVCPLLTDEVTAIGSDGMSYTFGTSTGNVRVANLDNVNHCLLYRVSDQPIRFVSVVSKAKKIYWTTESEFGQIDISDRSVKLMPRKSLSVVRIVSSGRGGLVVQRDAQVLGIFVEGVEQYWASDVPIVDFCLNQQRSSTRHGEIAVLTRHYLVILSYAVGKIEKRVAKRKLETDSTATTIGWYGNRYAIGFTNGSVSAYHVQNGALLWNSLVKNSSIKFVLLYEDIVVGLSHDGSLFEIDNSGKTSLYHSTVSQIVSVRSKVILVLHTDGRLVLLKVPSFELLAANSDTLELPQLHELQSEKILANPVCDDSNDELLPELCSHKRPPQKGLCYMSGEGRDFWLHILKKQPLRMMFYAADGKSKEYEETVAKVVTMSTPTNVFQRHKIFTTLLYANRFNEAADSLFAGAGASTVDGLMRSTILAVAVSGFEDGVSEEQCARIKPAGISLILNGHSSSGANLLKLAKLDSVAIEYLLQTNHVGMALKFIRALDSEEERKQYCFEIAKSFWEKKRIREAFFFFLSANELHPALFALYKMNLVVDCFFLKFYLMKNNMLVEVDQCKAKLVPGLASLQDLCQMIDADFRSRLERLKIPTERFFPK